VADKDVDELFKLWKEMVAVWRDGADAAINQTETAWTDLKAGTYDSKRAMKDYAEAFANSVGVWRKTAVKWNTYNK
jgi:predicted P-loop ATPase